MSLTIRENIPGQQQYVATDFLASGTEQDPASPPPPVVAPQAAPAQMPIPGMQLAQLYADSTNDVDPTNSARPAQSTSQTGALASVNRSLNSVLAPAHLYSCQLRQSNRLDLQGLQAGLTPQQQLKLRYIYEDGYLQKVGHLPPLEFLNEQLKFTLGLTAQSLSKPGLQLPDFLEKLGLGIVGRFIMSLINKVVGLPVEKAIMPLGAFSYDKVERKFREIAFNRAYPQYRASLHVGTVDAVLMAMGRVPARLKISNNYRHQLVGDTARQATNHPIPMVWDNERIAYATQHTWAMEALGLALGSYEGSSFPNIGRSLAIPINIENARIFSALRTVWTDLQINPPNKAQLERRTINSLGEQEFEKVEDPAELAKENDVNMNARCREYGERSLPFIQTMPMFNALSIIPPLAIGASGAIKQLKTIAPVFLKYEEDVYKIQRLAYEKEGFGKVDPETGMLLSRDPNLGPVGANLNERYPGKRDTYEEYLERFEGHGYTRKERGLSN